MEAFKHSIGQPGPDGNGRLLHHDLATLEAKLRDILPHPECPCCAVHDHAETPRIPSAATGPTDDLLNSNLEVWKPFMGHEFAAFPGFDDESIEQIPLRISALPFQPVSATSADHMIYGVSLTTSDDARLRTLMNAARSRVVASETIRPEKREKVNEVPVDVVQPEQIVGWLGNSPRGSWAGASLAAKRLGDGTLALRCWSAPPTHGDATTRFLLSSLSILGLEQEISESSAPALAPIRRFSCQPASLLSQPLIF